MQGFGLLSLRLVVGLTFIAHGLPKLFAVWGTGPRATAALFDSVGLTPAYPLAIGTGIVEVLAGALLVAGAYTVWVTLLLIATTATIAWKSHAPHGFFLNWSLEPGVGHGYEFALVLVSALVCLMLMGPSLFSIDRRRVRVAEARKLNRAVLRARKM